MRPPLKLLIAKLRRMQFGRSSEKLDRQIEPLELRLEALQLNDAETVTTMPEAIATAEPVARLVRRPLPAHLPSGGGYASVFLTGTVSKFWV